MLSSTSSPVLSEVRDLEETIMQMRTDMDQLAMQLKTGAPNDAESVVIILESAMRKVARAAAVLQTPELLSSESPIQMSELLAQIRDAFDRAERQANESLENLVRAQGIVIDRSTHVIESCQQRLSVLTAQNQSRRENVTSEMDASRKRFDDWRRKQQASMSHAEALQKDMERLQGQGQALSFAALFGNPAIYAAANGMQSAVIEGRRRYEEVTRNIAEVNQALAASQQQLVAAAGERTVVVAEQNALDMLQNSISVILPELRIAKTQGSIAQTAILDLQKASAHLNQLAAAMVRSTSTIAQSDSTKDEIILGLLKICDMVLVHPRLRDECRKVSSELATAYQGQNLPDNIDSILGSVQKKLEQAE